MMATLIAKLCFKHLIYSKGCNVLGEAHVTSEMASVHRNQSMLLRLSHQTVRIQIRNLHRACYRTSRLDVQSSIPAQQKSVDRLAQFPFYINNVRAKSTSAMLSNSELDLSGSTIKDISISDSGLDFSTLSDGVTGDIVNSVSTLAEPTLTSLGLGGWLPSGLVQLALEHMHIGLDIPWWQAIVIGTVCVRIAIFPLVILAQRNAAKMFNHMPTITRLQQKFTQARMSGDAVEAVAVSNELTDYMVRNGVHPFKTLRVPLAQMPIFMSVFFGVTAMADLPVLSMKTGGILWFTDLTVADPTYALPALTCLTLLATVEVGADGIQAGAMQKQAKYIIRAMPFITLPFIAHFSSAMLCYWFTSNAFSLVQVLFLKIPAVRAFFNIPKLVKHDEAHHIRDLPTMPKKSFTEAFRESMKNAQLAAEMKKRQQLNSLHLKEPTNKQLPKLQQKQSGVKTTEK